MKKWRYEEDTEEIDMYSVREICKYRMKGWLNQDASVDKEGIIAKFTTLNTVSEEDILACFKVKNKDNNKVFQIKFKRFKN